MVDKEEPETLVIFRVWKPKFRINSGDNILALFPGVDDGLGNCSSYEHVGQHGGADYNGCVMRTRPAKPSEYQDLKQELEQLGYRLKVIQRYQRRR